MRAGGPAAEAGDGLGDPQRVAGADRLAQRGRRRSRRAGARAPAPAAGRRAATCSSKASSTKLGLEAGRRDRRGRGSRRGARPARSLRSSGPNGGPGSASSTSVPTTAATSSHSRSARMSGSARRAAADGDGGEQRPGLRGDRDLHRLVLARARLGELGAAVAQRLGEDLAQPRGGRRGRGRRPRRPRARPPRPSSLYRIGMSEPAAEWSRTVMCRASSSATRRAGRRSGAAWAGGRATRTKGPSRRSSKGAPDAVEALVAFVRGGPGHASVSQVDVHEEPARGPLRLRYPAGDAERRRAEISASAGGPSGSVRTCARHGSRHTPPPAPRPRPDGAGHRRQPRRRRSRHGRVPGPPAWRRARTRRGSSWTRSRSAPGCWSASRARSTPSSSATSSRRSPARSRPRSPTRRASSRSSSGPRSTRSSGAEDGHLAKELKRLFGDDSTAAVQHQLRQIMQDQSARMREDLLRQFSSADGSNPLADFKAAHLRSAREAATRQESQLEGMREQMVALKLELQSLRSEREKAQEIAAEVARGTAKGRPYEEAVAEAVDAIARGQGDDCDAVGDFRGARRAQGRRRGGHRRLRGLLPRPDRLRGQALAQGPQGGAGGARRGDGAALGGLRRLGRPVRGPPAGAGAGAARGGRGQAVRRLRPRGRVAAGAGGRVLAGAGAGPDGQGRRRGAGRARRCGPRSSGRWARWTTCAGSSCT